MRQSTTSAPAMEAGHNPLKGYLLSGDTGKAVKHPPLKIYAIAKFAGPIAYIEKEK